MAFSNFNSCLESEDLGVANLNKLVYCQGCKVFLQAHIPYLIKTSNSKPPICSKSTCKQSLVSETLTPFLSGKKSCLSFHFSASSQYKQPLQ